MKLLLPLLLLFTLALAKEAKITKDGFKVDVGCKKGFALSALNGDISAYFVSDSLISSKTHCSKLPKGKPKSDTCVSKSKKYGSQESLEKEHTTISCRADEEEDKGKEINRYLQKFQLTMEDFTGPITITYTCCGSEAPLNRKEVCDAVKLKPEKGEMDEELLKKVKGKFIKELHYKLDEDKNSWYLLANVCQIKSVKKLVILPKIKDEKIEEQETEKGKEEKKEEGKKEEKKEEKKDEKTEEQKKLIEKAKTFMCRVAKPCKVCVVPCHTLYYSPNS